MDLVNRDIDSAEEALDLICELGRRFYDLGWVSGTGGGISLRYAGLYPENVSKLVAIEGLGPSPKMLAERKKIEIDEGLRGWIDQLRGLSGRQVRRYPSVEDAANRMHEANPHLNAEQAHHLTVHGVNQNEDGTFSWKFDNYMRSWPPYDMPNRDLQRLWNQITCPTLLVVGKESWATDPSEDGRIEHFQDAEVAAFENAGHWVHHDQLDLFLEKVKSFIAFE